MSRSIVDTEVIAAAAGDINRLAESIQADVATLRRELRVGMGVPEAVEDGRLGQRDRVARTGRRQPPTVEDDEGEGRNGQRRPNPFRCALSGHGGEKEQRKLMLPRRSRRSPRGRGWRLGGAER